MNRIEIRNDDHGKLDEIVGHNVSVHLEQMTGHSWFLSIRDGAGDHLFWFASKNGKTHVECEYSEFVPRKEKP